MFLNILVMFIELVFYQSPPTVLKFVTFNPDFYLPTTVFLLTIVKTWF